MNSTILKPKNILVLVTAVLFLMLGFIGFQNVRFRVTGTTPGLNAVATATPFFQINFTKDVSPNGLSVAASSGALRSYSVKGHALIVALNPPLSVGKTYTITVVAVSSTSNAKLSNLSFSFKPQNISFDKLPAAQQQALLNQQDKNQIGSKDPIMAHLPYSTLDFTLEPLISSRDSTTKVSLQASLLLSASDLSDEAGIVAQYKQEVQDYITSLGLNPAAYAITYSVIQPTQ